jgi:hypothetical protein
MTGLGSFWRLSWMATRTPRAKGTLPLVEVTVADGLVVSAGTPKPGFSRSKARSARASWALLLAADGST